MEGAGGCESQCGRRSSAEAQPQHLVTEKHGRWARLTNPPGSYFWVMSLLFREEGGLVVKAGSDAGELPERCRASINHRRIQQRKHRGGMKAEAEQEEQAAVAGEQEGIWG